MRILIGKDASIAGSVRANLNFQVGGNTVWFRRLRPALRFLKRNAVDEVCLLDWWPEPRIRSVYDGKVQHFKTQRPEPKSKIDYFILHCLGTLERLLAEYGLFRLWYFPLHILLLCVCWLTYLWRRPIIIARVFASRLGHLAYNTHVLLCEIRKMRGKPIVVALYDSSQVANQQLWNMYKRKFSFAIKANRIQAFLNYSVIRKSRFFLDANWYGDVHEPLHHGRDDKIHLSFTANEEEKGRSLLRSMGIAPGDWFVCIHARDKSYLDKRFPQADWRYHDFRDCDIETYLKAAEYITEQGGYVFRMGAEVEKPLPETSNPRIIDYATKHRTDFGDIYLLAKCKFLLGSACGVPAVATIFGTPVAVANWVHLEYTTCLRPGDLFIPKAVVSSDGYNIGLRQNLGAGVGRLIRAENYKENKLAVVSNTAEEIYWLAREMNERLDGAWVVEAEDTLLRVQVRRIMDQPEYKCSGTGANVGAKFLRDNKWWVE